MARLAKMRMPENCEIVGPVIHLSAGWHVREGWIHISDGNTIFQVILNRDEWNRWIADLDEVARGRKRAAMLELTG